MYSKTGQDRAKKFAKKHSLILIIKRNARKKCILKPARTVLRNLQKTLINFNYKSGHRVFFIYSYKKV